MDDAARKNMSAAQKRRWTMRARAIASAKARLRVAHENNASDYLITFLQERLDKLLAEEE